MTPDPAPKSPKSRRDDRLKAALKANMGRRKAQARARADDDTAQGETGHDTGRDTAQTGGTPPAQKE